MKFKYEILYKHYALKKNIIHIRLTNHTGYPDKLIKRVFPLEHSFRLQKDSQSLFPLKQRKNFLEKVQKQNKFTWKKALLQKVRLVLTNQQTNEHLNKTN